MSAQPQTLIPAVQLPLADHITEPRWAEILIEALLHEGVDSIFGYPGGAVLHIYDELWRARDRVTHYLVRHEQGAVHMAEGYARASGRVGVALVTSGPGATNAMTGIANAYMDSTPIVVITGQVPIPLIGTDAFQEVDTVGITRSCVKHNYLVRDVRDLAPVVHEAFHLARTGRPGPIVIDIPKDVSAARTSYSSLKNISFPLVERKWPPDPQAVAESDLLIAVGVRFDDRVTGKLATFAPHARVVHIDIDPANVGKNRAPEISLVADAREALAALQTEIKKLGQLYIDRGIKCRAVWWKRIRAWQLEQPLRFTGSGDHIKPQTVIRELHRLTNGDALIVTDVGQHQMWAAQFYPFKRSRQWITSGGLGAMGYGVPAAIGAQLVLGDQMVVAVVGDGGFQMTNQELAMAMQYDLPIKVLIMNNGYLGMVRQWQEMFYETAYSEVDLSVSPDFVKLSEAYGTFGLRATRADELSDALSAGLSRKVVNETCI